MIKQRYRDKVLIGQGRFSDVYKVNDNGNDVVLKITEPMDESPPHNSKFELELLCKLDHQNVLKLIDYYEIGSELIMVMPLYEDVLHLLQRNCYKRVNLDGGFDRVNKLPLPICKSIISQLCSLLSYIHSQGVIHRDIKLANLLWKDSQLVLLDFGISWLEPDNHGTEPFANKICDVSTSIYKLPELIFSCRDYTSKIDMWSVAVLMTQLYSKDGEITDVSSDISLLSMILQKIGTSQLQNWVEVQDNESFKLMKFIDQKGVDLHELIPRCKDEVMFKILQKLFILQSTLRSSLCDVLEMIK